MGDERPQLPDRSPPALVRAVGASWDPPAEGGWAQFVFRPTFHPALVVTIEGVGEEALLHAASEPSASWGWYHRSKLPDDELPGPPDELLATPGPLSSVFALDPAEARAIWSAAEDLQGPTEVGAPGRDGMSVILRLRPGGAIAEFESWSPEPDATERRLLESVLRPVAASGDSPLPTLAQVVRRYLPETQRREDLG